MAEREYVPHAVTALLHLAGPQPTGISAQDPGTDEATVAVTLPGCLVYLRTRGAAEAIGQIWRRAAVEALALPRIARAFQPPHRFDSAEPSIVVHTHGRPPGFARLNREPGATTYLHVQVGGLTFFFHDKQSFDSVAGAFLRAAELGAQQLPQVDLRQAPITRPSKPGLAGQAAPGAREHLEQVSRHPARVAATSLAQLEDQLVAVVAPLQAALARTRAVRERHRHGAREHEAREQLAAAQNERHATDGQASWRAPATGSSPEQVARPLQRRPDGTSRVVRGSAPNRRGGQAP